MQRAKEETDRLRITLTTKVMEILRGCSAVKVLKEGLVEPELLHKAR
jgi:hypothetical protein